MTRKPKKDAAPEAGLFDASKEGDAPPAAPDDHPSKGRADKYKTKAALIEELEALRQRLAEGRLEREGLRERMASLEARADAPPARQAGPANPEPVAPVPTPVPTPEEPQAVRRALVAVPNEGMRTVIASILGNGGAFEVHVAADAAEVIERLGQARYHAIILDTMTPAEGTVSAAGDAETIGAVGATEAARAVRDWAARAGVAPPILVAILGYQDSEAEARQYLASGMDRCIGRPVNFRQLIEAASLPLQ